MKRLLILLLCLCASRAYGAACVEVAGQMQCESFYARENSPTTITSTTAPQLTLEYDATNETKFTASAGGDLTVAPTGDVLTFQNAVDSTTGFRVLDADGGVPILNVDTTNERVGIGIAAPGSRLEVTNTSTEDIFRADDNSSIVFKVIDGGWIGASPNGNAYAAAGRFLNIGGSHDSTASYAYGTLVSINDAPSGNSSGQLWGINGSVYTTTANAFNSYYLTGLAGTAGHRSNGTVNLLSGGMMAASNESTATVTLGQGISAIVSNSSTGTITTARALMLNIVKGSGAINLAYGIVFAGITASGGSSVYGVYMPVFTGGTVYGIYDVGNKQYFGGLVGLATTAPDKPLEINAATGGAIRLMYNDPDGTAGIKVDLSVDASGDYIILPSGLDTTITGHIRSAGVVPVVSTCGTTPSITANSTDTAGIITTGTADPNSCTVTFATAYAEEPACTITPQGNVTAYLSASSASAITVTFSAAINSTKFNYVCVGIIA